MQSTDQQAMNHLKKHNLRKESNSNSTKFVSIFSLFRFSLIVWKSNLPAAKLFFKTYSKPIQWHVNTSTFLGDSSGLQDIRRNCSWEIALCTNCTSIWVMRPTGSVAFTSRQLFPVDLFTEETILKIVLVCIINRQNTFLMSQIQTTFMVASTPFLKW